MDWRGYLFRGLPRDCRIGRAVFCDADSSAQLLTVAITMRPLPGPIAVSGQWVERLVLAFFPSFPEQVDVVDRIGQLPVSAEEFAVTGFADPN